MVEAALDRALLEAERLLALGQGERARYHLHACSHLGVEHFGGHAAGFLRVLDLLAERITAYALSCRHLARHPFVGPEVGWVQDFGELVAALREGGDWVPRLEWGALGLRHVLATLAVELPPQVLADANIAGCLREYAEGVPPHLMPDVPAAEEVEFVVECLQVATVIDGFVAWQNERWLADFRYWDDFDPERDERGSGSPLEAGDWWPDDLAELTATMTLGDVVALFGSIDCLPDLDIAHGEPGLGRLLAP